RDPAAPERRPMTSPGAGAPRFPFPPFPDSWYAVAWSSEVPAGSAVPFQAFGRDLVAFRRSDGVVQALDAHGKPPRSWTTRELHDRIWIWFSSTEAPPAWTLPDTLLDPELRWDSAGRLDRTFPSHPQDILENAVDPAHFLFIHGMSEVFDPETVYDEHCITT